MDPFKLNFIMNLYFEKILKYYPLWFQKLMKFSIDFSSFSHINRLKRYLYGNNAYNNDQFNIKLNGIEFSIPLDLAIYYSDLIFSVLENDQTVRELSLDVNFSNHENAQKIVDILRDQKDSNFTIESNNETDIIDFALFGKEFGNEAFINPIKRYIDEQKEKITIENVCTLIQYSNLFGHLENVNSFISFLCQHFHEICDNDKFIEWCCLDIDDVIIENVVSNDGLVLKDENQLLHFIINLSKKKSTFQYLFRYVHLEFCDASSCKEFIEYIANVRNEFNNYVMKSILSCITNRLYQENLPLKTTRLKRYTITSKLNKITIGSNNSEIIPDKYVQKLGENSFKFLYPSEDSTECKSLFKVTLLPGNYKVECVGASGGKGVQKEGGFGGYSCGVLEIKEISDLFLYIGGKGTEVSGQVGIYSPGGFNGGGSGHTGSYKSNAGSGGGATDIRLNSERLNDRIIVAGGGGGTGGFMINEEFKGGDGGGLNGFDGEQQSQGRGLGGSQKQPGKSSDNGAQQGSNNRGGDGLGGGASGGGGGGGFYGGGGGHYAGGGGGSGYISDKIKSMFGIEKVTKSYNNLGNGYVNISYLKN